MKITPKVLTSTYKEMVESNPALSSYLLSLDTGRKATPHSWLYEDESSDETLTRWLAKLATVQELPQFGERIYQFDLKQVEKFGPQGEIPPISEAIETLGPSYDPREQLPVSVKLSEKENRSIANQLFGYRLETKRPLSYERVVDDMRARDTLTTNSGAPDFGRRSVPTIKDRAIQDAMTGKAYDYPGIVLFRKYNGKLRPVIMYPMSMNLIEFSFTAVIQQSLLMAQNSFVGMYVTPWRGFEDVKKEFTFQWTNTQANGGDTTAMDAHFWSDKTEVVYNVVKYLFQRNYWESLHKCMMHINNIDVLVGLNAMLCGPHGIASGSGWTQLVETVYQLIMAIYRRVRFGQGIGDDFVWFTERIMASKELAAYLERWGLPANPAKQSTNLEDCTFLQRLFLRGYVSRENTSVLGGVYPTVRALNSSLNPEKFHRAEDWNSDMFCIRQYMILENTVDHPLFEEFVKFVVNGQKDLIPFAKLSAAELSSVQHESRLIPGLNPSYNQEKREKPLASFASIQYARTL